MTLTDFLLARIADDEAVAREAQVAATYPQFGDAAADALLGLAESEGAQSEALRHFARHDPARVLAECAAKRRIVEMLQHPAEDGVFVVREYARLTLELMARVFVDHEDYREEWRP